MPTASGADCPPRRREPSGSVTSRLWPEAFAPRAICAGFFVPLGFLPQRPALDGESRRCGEIAGHSPGISLPQSGRRMTHAPALSLEIGASE